MHGWVKKIGYIKKLKYTANLDGELYAILNIQH